MPALSPLRRLPVVVLSCVLPLVGATTALEARSVSAAAGVTITPITWDDEGLDSNNVSVGPNTYLIGARVCTTGASTDVTAAFTWDTANANIALAGPSTQDLGAFAGAGCADAYFDDVITRTSAAWNTARGYHITATAAGIGSASTPTPRQVFVNKIVSQNRNGIDSMTGPSTVYVGGTYTYTVTSHTATNGYGEIQDFPAFPDVIFRVMRVSVSYAVPTGGTGDSIWGDACGWDSDPTSPTYQSCVGPTAAAKVGGSPIVSTYTVRILSAGVATLVDSVTDFSGGSFHYNADYSTTTTALTVTASTPPPPQLTTTVTDSAGGTVSSGATDSLAITSTVASAGGTEANPVTVTSTVPAGLSVSGAPSGTGWDCSAGSGQSVSCTYTPTSTISNGTALPAITVPVSTASTFSHAGLTVAATSASSDNANSPSASTGSDTVTVVPVAQAASATTDAGTPVTLTPSAPAGSAPFTWSIATAPASGTASMTPSTGATTYTPAAGASGSVTYTYTVADPSGATSGPAVITITVRPVAAPASGSGTAPGPVVVTPPAPTGTGPFTYVLATTPPPADGTASIGSGTGTITFTPAPGFSGPVPTFTYTVTDAAATTSLPATVDITVNRPAAPVAGNLSGSTPVNTTFSGSVPAATGACPCSYAGATPPSSGVATLDPTTGAVTFAPPSGATGVFTFTYTATDTFGQASAPATVSVTVTPTEANGSGSVQAPNTLVGTVPVPVGTGPFTYAPATGPSHGTLTFAGDGSFTYAPAIGTSGPDSFTFVASDVHGIAAPPATFTIAVSKPVPPTVAPASITTPFDTPVTVTVPAASGTGPLTYTIGTPPPSGTATIDPSTGAITFTPASGSSGNVPLTYTATDPYGQVSNPAAVTVHVLPAARPASGSGTGAAPIHVTVPVAGTGPLTCALVASSLPPTTSGTATIDPSTCVVTFVPASGWTGTTTVQVVTVDAAGNTSPPAVVTVTVTAAATPVVTAPAATAAAAAAAVTAAPETGAQVGSRLLPGTLLAAGGLLMLVAVRLLAPAPRRRERSAR